MKRLDLDSTFTFEFLNDTETITVSFQEWRSDKNPDMLSDLEDIVLCNHEGPVDAEFIYELEGVPVCEEGVYFANIYVVPCSTNDYVVWDSLEDKDAKVIEDIGKVNDVIYDVIDELTYGF